MDTFTKTKRSDIMSRVRSYNTKPEIRVRSIIHKLGFRFSLYKKALPGAPDIVLPARKTVVFVHGCFWHGHKCKRGNRIPKTNTVYWVNKISRNKARDAVNRAALRKLGWLVIVVWECQIKNESSLGNRLKGLIPG